MEFLLAALALTVAPSPQEPAEPAADTEVVEIMTALAKLRGVDEVRAVERVFLDDAGFREALGEQLDKNTDAEYFDRFGSAFVRLGLMPEEVLGVLRDAALDSMLTSHQALYDPWTKRIVARDRLEDATSRLVGTAFVQRLLLVHELAHALQDQRFDLVRYIGAQSMSWDRRMASAALVEGDAVVMAAEWTTIGSAESVVMSDVDIGADTRASIENSLLLNVAAGGALIDATVMVFSYGYGAALVQQLVRAGGWSAVDAAFAEPPLSAEQVLHPSKYMTAKDWPVAIEPLPPQAVLDAGWSVRARDVLGELFVHMIVKGGEGESAAIEAAYGWDGDRFVLFERGDERAMVWVTCWDSELDAQQAAKHLGELLRFGREREGVVRRERKRNFGHVTLRREGARVVITSGFEEEHFEALERAAFDATLHPHADDAALGANDAAETRRLETAELERLAGANGIVDGLSVRFTDIGLTLQLPNDEWTRAQAPAGLRAVFVRGAPTTNFNLTVAKGAPPTLEALLERSRRELETIVPDVVFERAEISEVDGVGCIVTRYMCTIQGMSVYGMQHVFPIDGQQVCLTCSRVGEPIDDALLVEFEALLGSARFDSTNAAK